jgi:uncharacterized protein (DUF2384 family)
MSKQADDSARLARAAAILVKAQREVDEEENDEEARRILYRATREALAMVERRTPL